jgi:hypothetical protein
MFVLLQIYPLEAAGDDDLAPLDAIAVDSSEQRLEDYLAGYQPRYCAACAEFAARDEDEGPDWTSEHDRLSGELAEKHDVYGCLIPETTFEVVEVLAPRRAIQ